MTCWESGLRSGPCETRPLRHAQLEHEQPPPNDVVRIGTFVDFERENKQQRKMEYLKEIMMMMMMLSERNKTNIETQETPQPTFF
jgi:hypothetical protein